jgi:hypothetical protein
MYKFSEKTTAEFYGRKFYEIQNESGKCVAYSERVFEIPEAVKFLGGGKCLIFEKANFLGGDFRGGNFYGGNFYGGNFRGGDFRGGNFYGGNFYGGYFLGGNFHGGDFHGGDFYGGNFRGGDFRGGYFLGGNFRGGNFHGGNFHGGNFHGGDFYGGDFRGGDFWGGTYEVSMLQIQGTQHFCYAYPQEDGSICLGIGCERHSIEWWIENYASIGQEKNYTAEQVDEYKMYIDLFAARYPSK